MYRTSFSYYIDGVKRQLQFPAVIVGPSFAAGIAIYLGWSPAMGQLVKALVTIH